VYGLGELFAGHSHPRGVEYSEWFFLPSRQQVSEFLHQRFYELGEGFGVQAVYVVGQAGEGDWFHACEPFRSPVFGRGLEFA